MLFDEVLPPPDADAGKPRIRVVFAAALGSPRTAQGAMQALSTILPLDACNLTHLKRITKISAAQRSSGEKKLMVILAPAEHWYALPEETRHQLCSTHQLGPPVAMQVPAQPAESREDFDEAQSMGWWPQTFHPRTPTATIAGLPLTPSDAAAMLHCLWAALADRAAGGDENRSSPGGLETGLPAGGVLVDPRTGEVLVCASRVRSEMVRDWAAVVNAEAAPSQDGSDICVNRNDLRPTASLASHPLHTATMLCVHGLAWCHQASRNTSLISKSEDSKTEPRSKRSRDEVTIDSDGDTVDGSSKDVPSPAQSAQSVTTSSPAPRSAPRSRDLACLGAVPWHTLPGAETAAKAAADMVKDEEQTEGTATAASATVATSSEAGGVSSEGNASEAEVIKTQNSGPDSKKVNEKEEDEVPYLCTGLDLYLTHEVWLRPQVSTTCY